MRSRFAMLLALLLTITGWAAGAAHAVESATAPHLTVSLVVPPRQLYPGQNFTAGLHFKLERGWHVYWSNAGDSGEPPKLAWTLPAGVTADPFQYPAPKRLPLGPLMDFGYENEVLFPVTFHTAPTLVAGAQPAVLAAKVNWLVCRESCVPGKAELSVERPVVKAGPVASDAQAEAMVAKGIASLPQALPAGDTAHFKDTGKTLTLAVVTGSEESAASFFPFDQTQIANAAPQNPVAVKGGVEFTLAKDENLQAAPKQLHGLVTLADGHTYEVTATPGTLPAPATSASAAGLLQAAGLAFIGGLILNLMPCVFPVLFIKGLSLVQSSGEERGRMRAHGWVYTLGIVASFWVVVGVLLALRAAGHQLGWGFQFQSPVFLAVMALFLFFLALSLAGMFEIGLSLTSAGGSLANKSGYAGSFFTGVLAMVVATPCTAPFMGAAIGYALAESALVSFAVFTALGLGLALPYLLLAYNPAWTRLLPRPGAWMEVLKQAISVPIFMTVIWLVWLFTQSGGPNALLGLLGAFLLLAVAGWILGRWPAKLPATLSAAAVLVFAIALPVYAVQMFGAPVGAPLKAAGGNDWKPFTPEIVEQSRAAGKPVLVDFTASWCLSCQVNERVVLDRADVQQRLRDSGVVLVRADWTRHDESIGQALAALGRSGIPAYALYPAAPGSAPQLLPEVLTTGIVYSALDSIRKPQAAAQGF